MSTAFQEHDLILREGDTLRQILHVYSVQEDGTLLAYPNGGGFVGTISTAELSKFRKVDPVAAYRQYEAGQFALDYDEPVFEGWTDGSLWNGWERPVFSLEEGKKIAAYLGPTMLQFDEEQDCFVENHPEDPDREPVFYGTVMLGLPDGTSVKVYPIGRGEWTWILKE